MNKIKLFDRRVGFSLGALSILFGTMAPAVVPAFASADSQITSRSIAMDNTVASATGVSYKATFTPNEGNGTTQYWVGIEFCSNSPLISSTCTAPTGMSLSGVTVTAPNLLATGTTVKGANFVIVATPNTSGLTSGSPYSITLGGITNPSTTGTFYAKILVYDGESAAEGAATGGTGGGAHGLDTGNLTSGAATVGIDTGDSHLLDDGAVALSTNDAIGVTAAVLESLTFCVRGDAGNNATSANGSGNNKAAALTSAAAANAPDSGCASASSTSAAVTLGDYNSGTATNALSASDVSYQLDWAQISTNAGHGAVVYMRSNLACAGLARSSDGGTCNIPGLQTGALTSGTAGFGLSFGTAQETTSDGNVGSTALPAGKGAITTYGAYSSGAYAQLSSGTGPSGEFNGLPLNTTSGSPYGGAVFDTTGAPVSNANVPIGIGATIANNTAAGLYKANLALIAVGTF